MKRLLTILLLIFISCDSEEEIKKNYQLITGRYEPYINKFNVLYSASIDNLIIKEIHGGVPVAFPEQGILGGAKVSDSYTDFTGQRYILLDTSYLNRFPDKIEKVLFHEMGRVVFQRDYEWENQSLMYWSIHAQPVYNPPSYNYYRWELLAGASEEIRSQYTYTGTWNCGFIIRRTGLPCDGGNPHDCGPGPDPLPDNCNG